MCREDRWSCALENRHEKFACFEETGTGLGCISKLIRKRLVILSSFWLFLKIAPQNIYAFEKALKIERDFVATFEKCLFFNVFSSEIPKIFIAISRRFQDEFEMYLPEAHQGIRSQRIRREIQWYKWYKGKGWPWGHPYFFNSSGIILVISRISPYLLMM